MEKLTPVKMDNITSISSLAYLYKESEADRVTVEVRMTEPLRVVPATMELIFFFYWIVSKGDVYRFKRAFTFEELSRMFVPGEQILDLILQSAKIVWAKKIQEMTDGSK